MRLIQFLHPDGSRGVAACLGSEATHRVVAAGSVRELALDAYARGQGLATEVESRLTDAPVDIAELAESGRLLVPLDHEDPARMTLAITGLTHLGSATTRAAMHARLATDDSDSMRMFKLGMEAGKPAAGRFGAQPEWAYKGDGSWLAQPGAPLLQPGFAEDGGEEAEIAGLYVVAPDGTVLRVGFALGNEYSDHVMERRNYLDLAHSKLRGSSFGPELLVGDLPRELEGDVTVRRRGEVVWASRFISGEDNMCHSIANLEAHHFKYPGFRRPGQVHVYFYGASVLSFSDGFRFEDGDVTEISAAPFGYPLHNSLTLQPAAEPVAIKAL